jgi:hypothetical protein
MTLIDNIKAIHGGSIFTIGVEDALLFEKKVFKNNEDVGLSDRKINYFYTRYDDRPIKIQKSKNKFSSCYPYEVVSPKILVLQFKDFDLDGIMYAVLNEFNKNYDSTTYEVGQVEIRKEIILKDEIGEIKPFEGTHVLKFYYTESKPLNDCTEITCNGTEVIPITNEVLIYINDVLQYTQECNTDLELTLINQDGAPITATFNGTEIVVNQLGADANVQNSDASYNVNVVSGGALVVPDETITINSASFITKASVKTQDILLKDVSGNTITPVSLVSNTISILDAVVIKGCKPIQSGQTTSYASNDDGATQRGRLTSFSVLPYNNPFGNTNRFTDTLGGQTYANKIVMDWSTWIGTKVLGFVPVESNILPNQNWTDWNVNSPYTIGTYGGFYTANIQEVYPLINSSVAPLQYAPFNTILPSLFLLFTGTIAPNTSGASAYAIRSAQDIVNVLPISGSRGAMLVKDFTISGTTLS